MTPTARDARSMRRRGAVCVTPENLTVVAMATADNDEASALALQRIGCQRAASLDRGSHIATFLHRAGGGSPPLARYGETVLYAISRPLTPRAFRWSPRPTRTRFGLPRSLAVGTDRGAKLRLGKCAKEPVRGRPREHSGAARTDWLSATERLGWNSTDLLVTLARIVSREISFLGQGYWRPG